MRKNLMDCYTFLWIIQCLVWFCYLYQMRHNQDTSSYRELFQRPDEGPEIWYVADIQIALNFERKKYKTSSCITTSNAKNKNMFTPGIFPWWMSKQHTYKVYIIIILLHTDFPIDFSLHCSRRFRPVLDYPPSNSLLYVATHLSHQPSQQRDSCAAKQTVAFIVWPLNVDLSLVAVLFWRDINKSFYCG